MIEERRLVYYNEFDPYPAQWLRNLGAAGHIPRGCVDERSIADVRGDDLAGFAECHFFAGIGGWPLALKLAGWPEDREVWTGSCPCQPFSTAGKRRGTNDERHVWPEFHRLIAERKPATVFGEQVASADGRAWLDRVRRDLEALGYAVGAADLCAAGVGAPHIRQRLYWVAHAIDIRRTSERNIDVRQSGDASTEVAAERGSNGATGGRDDADSALRKPALGGVPISDVADAARSLDAWADYELLQCNDGRSRRTQPGLFPLAHGLPGRVGRIRAYGNAIVPQLAAAFVASFLEINVDNLSTC